MASFAACHVLLKYQCSGHSLAISWLACIIVLLKLLSWCLQLVDPVLHELRCSSQDPEEQPVEVDVVFFHGLQINNYANAWRHTWLSKPTDGSQPVCWPATWLKEDFPNARMLSLSYDTGAIRTHSTGRQTLDGIADTLLNAILSPRVGLGQRPIVLVGHSLGGLVLKRLCTRANEASYRGELKCKALLDSIKGMVFYSTPHAGSHMADLADWASQGIISLGPVMTSLATLKSDVAELNNNFDFLKRTYRWQLLAMGEKNELKIAVRTLMHLAGLILHRLQTPSLMKPRILQQCFQC
jgi:pimeloyl-ACP methyl ester carboxylesterase